MTKNALKRQVRIVMRRIHKLEWRFYLCDIALTLNYYPNLDRGTFGTSIVNIDPVFTFLLLYHSCTSVIFGSCLARSRPMLL